MPDEIHMINEALPSHTGPSTGSDNSAELDLDAAAQAIGLERHLAYLPAKKRSRNADRVKQCRKRAAERGIAPVTVSLPTAHHQAVKTLAHALKQGTELPMALKEVAPGYLPICLATEHHALFEALADLLRQGVPLGEALTQVIPPPLSSSNSTGKSNAIRTSLRTAGKRIRRVIATITQRARRLFLR